MDRTAAVDSIPSNLSVLSRRAFGKRAFNAAANRDLPLPFGPTKKFIEPTDAVWKTLPLQGSGRGKFSAKLIIGISLLTHGYAAKELMRVPLVRSGHTQFYFDSPLSYEARCHLLITPATKPHGAAHQSLIILPHFDSAVIRLGRAALALVICRPVGRTLIARYVPAR